MNLPTREEVLALDKKALVDAVALAQGWSACRRPKDTYYNITFDPKGGTWWTGSTVFPRNNYWPLDWQVGFGHFALFLILKYGLAIEPRDNSWFVWSPRFGTVNGFECASLCEAICRTVVLNFREDPKPDLGGHLPPPPE